MVPGPEHIYVGSNKSFDVTKRLLNKKALQCAISGKRAKYIDPMTKMTYATKDAFKILREKFYQMEEEKLNQRIQALNELLSLKKDKHKRHKSGKPDVEPILSATAIIQVTNNNKGDTQHIAAVPENNLTPINAK